MPKYYVVCGDIKVVIDRKTAKQAAIDVFKLKLSLSSPTFNPKTFSKIVRNLAELVKVGEMGFDKVQDTDMWFNMTEIAEAAGFKKRKKK